MDRRICIALSRHPSSSFLANPSSRPLQSRQIVDTIGLAQQCSKAPLDKSAVARKRCLRSRRIYRKRRT